MIGVFPFAKAQPSSIMTFGLFPVMSVIIVSYQSKGRNNATPTSSPISTPILSPKLLKKTTEANFDGSLGGYEITYCANKTLAINGQVLWGSGCSLDLTFSFDGVEM